MPNSIASDVWSVRDPTGSDEGLGQRRLRHIDYVQVRNLTPFPVRDAFASALAQPSARSQFNAHGNLSDDLDITIGRRLSRRISTTSTHTSKSVKSDADDGPPLSPTDGRRKRSPSKASSRADPPSPLVGGSVRRSSQRSRHVPHPSSVGSSSSMRRRESTGTLATTIAAASSVSRVFSDLSQTGLETVVNSRLVETFISVSVPEVPIDDPRRSPAKRSFHSPPATPIKHSPSIPPQSTHRRGPSVNGSGPTPRPSVVSNGVTQTKRHSGRHVALKLSSPKTSHRSATSMSYSFPPSCTSEGSLQYPPVPNFISPIHRPSINPAFTLDDLSTPGIVDWTDLGLQRMKVELWGRVGTGWGVSTTVKGKGKEREPTSTTTDEWKPLETWEVDLAGLVPLPEHIASNPTLLPSNTLLIRLSPPGQTYYLPQVTLSRSSSRPPSPTGGHVSDPETDTSKSREGGSYTIARSTSHVRTLFQPEEQEPSGHLTRGRGRHLREPAKTASWNDLLKLANLHAVIHETKHNLAEVEHNVNLLIGGDLVQPLKRGEALLERRISDVQCDRQEVLDNSGLLNERIKAKREELVKRRDMLVEANKLLEDQRDDASEADMLLHAESNLAALRSRLTPTRTTLLSTLASIFPIELLSPPDLLYIILAVPLPIPLSVTDPGPPLSMPAHRDVTEEGVATALGFVAQVVQLMAVYLGEVLVYPITCVGSRSLIKDGISAMVGPRMFPLFSKGVDTYRFEYGVFLLNKNIEMLMANRNLRALDMRHTLPNLKNLLLTLTSGEGVQLPRSESVNSLPTVGLRTPPRVASPVPTVRVSETALPADEPVQEGVTAESPPGSGSATPTNGPTIDCASGRKSMAFLDLSPFTGFLRSRYPPSTRNISRKSSSSGSSDVRSVDIGSEADDGSETVEQDASGGERGRTEMNGHANGTRVKEEKHAGEEGEDGMITPVIRGVLLHPTATG